MSQARDLTRWNRAGLDRFRYIDGNAVTFLEILREALSDHFPQWKDIGIAPPAGDTPAESLARAEALLAQYHDPVGDVLWETMRSLARSSHILAEHMDIYANEGYLQTASQWDNVRRLVQMLDYRPAPPASASTIVSLEIKEGASGTVAKGFQVKYAPADGAPVIFESLEDLEAGVDFNKIRLSGYGSSPVPVYGKTLIFDGEIKGLKIGQPLVVKSESKGTMQGRLIAGLTVSEKKTTVELHQPLSKHSGFILGDTLIFLNPADRLAPLGPGKGGEAVDMIGKILHLEERPVDLRSEEILFVSDGKRMYFRRVLKTRDRMVYFDQALGSLSLKGAWATRARLVSVLDVAERSITESGEKLFVVRTSGDLSSLAKTWAAKIIDKGGMLVHFEIFSAVYSPVDAENPDSGGYTELKMIDPDGLLANPQTLWVMPQGRSWNVDTYLDRGAESLLPKTITAEMPKKTSAADLAAVVSGKQLAWAYLANVAVDEDAGVADFTVNSWHHRGGGRFYLKETFIYSHFKEEKRLRGWDINNSSVGGASLILQDQSVAAKLVVGRRLLIEKKGDAFLETVLSKIEGTKVTLNPALLWGGGYTVDNTLLRANIVSAGHGESKPAKVLGSGDATRSNQSFVLKVGEVSFVADATQPAGVRADIEISVAGRIWEQVGSLNDSEPTDHHYTVQMTEEGYLKVIFGDGSHGRRLPGGTNNVRITYRTGTGSRGNLAAGSLEKIVKPHPLIKAVHHYTDATGGNDMEDASSMRDNAPATVLTLERAVSLNDFANLAVSHSSVRQARAFALPPIGRNERIRVVVVPAGSTLSNDLKKSLQIFLVGNAIPGINLQVEQYQPLYFLLDVLIRVKSDEYEPDTVKEEVRSRLSTSFSVDQRQINQPLYLSEVYQVVEATTGVENSRCKLQPLLVPPASDPPPLPIRGRDNTIRVLRAGEHQLITLAENSLIVNHEEYQL